MKTALIIDDDHSVADMLQRVLQRYGFDVWVATSPPDLAASFVEHDQVDLVGLDWNLPTAAEGARALSIVRERHPEALIVISSGDEVTAPSVAGLPCLEKPYRISDVRTCLAQLGMHLGDPV